MIDIPLRSNCFVSSITVMALKKLGLESLEWEPMILRDAFELAYDIKKLPQRSFDKLNCGYALVGTNAFVSTIEGFLAGTSVMNNRRFEEREASFCTLEMCAWSVWEYINLMGELENGAPTEAFHSDIIKYIQSVARLNGVSTMPAWLKFAEASSEQLPDMSGDLALFEMYQARQSDYVDSMNNLVKTKQEALEAELSELETAHIIAQKTA